MSETTSISREQLLPIDLSARGALDTIQAAAYLSVERSTLKKWRTLGTGPTYARLGSKIVYLVDDLDEFLRSHRVSA